MHDINHKHINAINAFNRVIVKSSRDFYIDHKALYLDI